MSNLNKKDYGEYQRLKKDRENLNILLKEFVVHPSLVNLGAIMFELNNTFEYDLMKAWSRFVHRYKR